jgi:hypothetical protein
MAGFEALIGRTLYNFLAVAQHVHLLLTFLSFVAGILLIPFCFWKGPTGKIARRFCRALFLLSIGFGTLSTFVYPIAGFDVFVGQVFNGFFAQANSIHTLLSFLSFVGGVLLIPFSAGEEAIGKNRRRFCGSLFLLSIAFEASSAWVYSVVVFIVATLITEAEFLSGLAAIFLDRPWALPRPATPRESEISSEEDVEADSSSPPTIEGRDDETDHSVGVEQGISEVSTSAESVRRFVSTDKRILSAQAYERSAFDALLQTGLFDDIQREMAITTITDTGKPLVVVDGIGKYGPSHYVIETKLRIGDLQRIISQIRFAMTALRNTPELKRKLIKGSIRGLIICPPDQSRGQNFHENIAYLLYDQNAREFTNLDQVRNWVKGS